MKSAAAKFTHPALYLGPHPSCVLWAYLTLISSFPFSPPNPNSELALEPHALAPKSWSKTTRTLLSVALGASPRALRLERLSTSESGLKAASPLYSRCERTVPASRFVPANLPRDTDPRTPAPTPASSLKVPSPLCSRCQRTVPTSHFVAVNSSRRHKYIGQHRPPTAATSHFVAVNSSRDIGSRSIAPAAAQRQPGGGCSGCGVAHKRLIYHGDKRTVFWISAVGPLVISGRSFGGAQIAMTGLRGRALRDRSKELVNRSRQAVAKTFLTCALPFLMPALVVPLWQIRMGEAPAVHLKASSAAASFMLDMASMACTS
jgi:hypothetical protein